MEIKYTFANIKAKILYYYIGLILKCNPISENTKHFKSCTK